MGKIFYIMGKSSSGKDTIYGRLLSDQELGLNQVVSYTTRPIRAGEREGSEYHFVSEAKLQRLEQSGRVIELRAYHTVHGVWKYFTVDDGQIAAREGDCLMIGTVESYEAVRRYYGASLLVPILIELDDGIRLQRALDRERSQDHPRYREMCRRFLADEEDFSEQKLAQAGIRRRFSNENLEECLENIKIYIRGMQNIADTTI